MGIRLCVCVRVCRNRFGTRHCSMQCLTWWMRRRWSRWRMRRCSLVGVRRVALPPPRRQLSAPERRESFASDARAPAEPTSPKGVLSPEVRGIGGACAHMPGRRAALIVDRATGGCPRTCPSASSSSWPATCSRAPRLWPRRRSPPPRSRARRPARLTLPPMLGVSLQHGEHLGSVEHWPFSCIPCIAGRVARLIPLQRPLKAHRHSRPPRPSARLPQGASAPCANCLHGPPRPVLPHYLVLVGRLRVWLSAHLPQSGTHVFANNFVASPRNPSDAPALIDDRIGAYGKGAPASPAPI